VLKLQQRAELKVLALAEGVPLVLIAVMGQLLKLSF